LKIRVLGRLFFKSKNQTIIHCPVNWCVISDFRYRTHALTVWSQAIVDCVYHSPAAVTKIIKPQPRANYDHLAVYYPHSFFSKSNCSSETLQARFPADRVGRFPHFNTKDN